MAKKNKYENYTREELIDELESLKKKRYGLVWDRKNSQELIDAFVNWENVPENFAPNKFPVLKEVKNKEISTDKNKPINLLIEGDNYHSLAVLNFTHKNKVDVIYIDPPYNTGNNDFVFNDNFVDKEDDFRHSKWLTFMEKRLKLAQNLLKENGVMFISIDDNEIAQLKMLLDEIFGENNFVSTLIWEKVRIRKNSALYFTTNHDFILCIAKKKKQNENNKGWERQLLGRESEGNYKNPDNDPNGPWIATSVTANHPYSADYKITKPNGVVLSKPQNSSWRYSWETLQNFIKEGRIIWGKGNSYPKVKRYLKDVKEGLVPKSIFDFFTFGGNPDGANELKNLFGGKKVFENPKPTKLISALIKIGSSNKNAIILDFFAGTGTTGNAVEKINNEDGGNRKFIICTNNENNICTEVCYPRIAKVIKGYKNEKGEKIDGLGGNLKYLKTAFVGAAPTDKNKRDLVNNSAEMICIKEDIFDLVSENNLDWKIYQKGKKYLGIVFNEEVISDFKKVANKYKGQFIIYCFSYTETPPEKEFADLKNKHRLEPIPEIILKVYREIFKK